MLISEYTGGGFGSKITGGVSLIIPALLSKKANAPVMMRISREEETFIGRARPSLLGRMKVGFSKEGRITALDMFVVSNNGPYDTHGRRPLVRPHRLAAVSAAGHALARRHGADQHSAAQRAELAGRYAGHRHHRADYCESRAQAGYRPGRHSAHQLPGGQGAVRAAVQGKRAARHQLHSSRKRSTAARSSSSGTEGWRALPSGSARKCAAWASR